jgi:tetratricopeptide (TPR) repeat protein
VNRAGIYAERFQFDEAIADYSRALEIEPRNVPAYYSRGNAYGEKGLFEEAIADYNRLLVIDPQFPHAYVRKGLALEKLGRPVDALTAYKAYLQNVEVKYQDPRQVKWVRDKIESLEKRP